MTREASLIEQECEYQVVDVSVNSTTVYNGPCLFYGATVTTALSAHAVPIQDNSTVIASFAASAAIGASLSFPYGVKCITSLVVNPDDAGAGIIVVYFRKLTTTS